MNAEKIIIPRHELCNVLRGSRLHRDRATPALKAARAALAAIYAGTQNRTLTESEDAAARGLIAQIHAEMRALIGQPALGGHTYR